MSELDAGVTMLGRFRLVARLLLVRSVANKVFWEVANDIGAYPFPYVADGARPLLLRHILYASANATPTHRTQAAPITPQTILSLAEVLGEEVGFEGFAWLDVLSICRA